MEIFDELFSRALPVPAELEKYGFQFGNGCWTYRKDLPDAGMYILVRIGVSAAASMYEADTEEEYVPVKLQGPAGPFVSEMREEFLSLLKDIHGKCFKDVRYRSPQAYRIVRAMLMNYRQPHKQSRDYAGSVSFCNAAGRRFVTVLKREDGEYLQCYFDDEAQAAPIDGIRLRERTDGLIEGEIPLDDSAADDVILDAVRISAALELPWDDEDADCWVIPANPSYFDLEHAFAKSDILYWHQNTAIAVNDRIFIYYGLPYSEILYECRAEECGLILEGDAFDERKYKRHMRIRLVRRFSGHILTRSFIAQYGLKAVRGARRMPQELAEIIDTMFDERGNRK